ncbi:MAG: GGDEF domain-containing protein [Elusimicrobia bacterium]|nr:GGDEF domain-containing protein [Elusimicrobiota bacterium]
MANRSLTLLGSMLLFAAVSAGLFLAPAWDLVVYPAYALVFIWNDLRGDEESHIIFVFLATAAAFLTMTREPGAAGRVALALEAFSVWTLSFGLGFHRASLAGARKAALVETDKLDAELRDSERELKFYNTFESSAVTQIRLRRDLTQAAKSLGTTMDGGEVQRRLLRIAETRYKGSKVSVMPGAPQDPLVGWALKTQTPVLVRDMKLEDRFGPRQEAPPFRSAVVVPLTVGRKPHGFLRLESPKPDAFNNDDLRTADLFATLASMTLENIRLFEEAHQLATHDALTQLFTQRTFHQKLKEELLRAGRSQMPTAVLMCDIDNFKVYNDSYGHQAGDELLRTVSRLLTAHTRPVDVVARYGGEEFSIILPNTVRDQAVACAERIRQAVASEPFMFQGRRTRVTMSLGVAVFPQDAATQNQLVRVADERLYRSKEGGRDRVTS